MPWPTGTSEAKAWDSSPPFSCRGPRAVLTAAVELAVRAAKCQRPRRSFGWTGRSFLPLRVAGVGKGQHRLRAPTLQLRAISFAWHAAAPRLRDCQRLGGRARQLGRRAAEAVLALEASRL